MTIENTTNWIKATKSGGGGGNCVEMRGHVGQVEVRDTKDDGAGPILAFTKTEFEAWLVGAKNGEFDALA